MITSANPKKRLPRVTQQPTATIALMPCSSLFEDFFDTIGVSFEILRKEQTGGWMFNYIEALQRVNVQTVLIFISARVSEPMRFTHEPTGAAVCILPAPWLHRMFRWITNRKFRLDSYLLMPLGWLRKELRAYTHCAVLFQDYEYPSFDVCVLFGKLIRLPIFATFQGGTGSRSKLEHIIRTLSLRACTGLIIGSGVEYQRVHAKYHVPKQKIARIFNPMDVLGWSPSNQKESRLALDIPLGARVVICHGRIAIQHKGLDLLLDAWQKISNERPNRELCLLLVGTGQDAPKLQALIDSMKLVTVHWVNEYIRDRSLLWQYLSTADVYVMASRSEGFPVAPIEAMACGLPIVATDVPGIPDILEGGEISGGLIVPKEDTDALATALGYLLDREEWGRELGKRARHRAEACFSLEAIGQQMRDFLFGTAISDETP
jgi:starch synthase